MATMTDITFLHMSGLLAENGTYCARRGHESPRRKDHRRGNPDFQLVLLDGEDRVLLSVAPEVTPRGCGTARDAQEQTVRGVLPLHPDAATYELRREDIRLYRARIPGTAPKVAHLKCHHGAGAFGLQWAPAKSAGEPPRQAPGPGPAPDLNDRGPVTYSVVAEMESGRRITIAAESKELSHTCDLSRLPIAGKGTVYVVANDGVRSSEVKAGAIEVPARPPTMHILAPAPKSPSIPFGQALSLLGCCLDMGGQPCPPEHAAWYLDGQRIASGSLLAAHDCLQPGAHRLTLAYEPPGGERVETTVTLNVDEPDEHYRQWQALLGPAPSAASGS